MYVFISIWFRFLTFFEKPSAGYDSTTNILTKIHAFLLPDFSYDGTRLIASSDDDSIVVYDCEKVSSYNSSLTIFLKFVPFFSILVRFIVIPAVQLLVG